MKSGFTLIEVLIVIAIVTLLAVAGLQAFSSSRETVLLDIETDKLVALLQDSRALAQKNPACYGIGFRKKDIPQELSRDFANRVDGCSGAFEGRDVLISRDIEVRSITTSGGHNLDEVDVWFIPPYGIPDFPSSDAELYVEIALRSNPLLARRIAIHRLTGSIEKLSLSLASK